MIFGLISFGFLANLLSDMGLYNVMLMHCWVVKNMKHIRAENLTKRRQFSQVFLSWRSCRRGWTLFTPPQVSDCSALYLIHNHTLNHTVNPVTHAYTTSLPSKYLYVFRRCTSILVEQYGDGLQRRWKGRIHDYFINWTRAAWIMNMVWVQVSRLTRWYWSDRWNQSL